MVSNLGVVLIKLDLQRCRERF